MMTTSSTTHFPDRDKLSVVTAAMAIAILSGRFVHLPAWQITVPLPGFTLPIHFGLPGAMALLIAALTVAGVDWILGDHPALETRTTLPHWLLPALTAWVLEVLLQRLPGGIAWWSTLFAGIGLWFLVMLAEYIVVDGEDLRYPLAATGLIALGFLLFFLLTVAVRSAGLRLFFTAPMLGLAAATVALRAFNLQLHGLWKPVEAIFILAITTQLAAAFHYLPIPPVAFGLILTAITYAATVYIGNLLEEEPPSQAVVEPLVVLALLLLLLPLAW